MLNGKGSDNFAHYIRPLEFCFLWDKFNNIFREIKKQRETGTFKQIKRKKQKI